MRNTEVTFQKRPDGAWFFKDPFDKYGPFQRVKNQDMLYAFLDLNFERTSPQTRMASYVLVQAFTDDEQAQALREVMPQLFEPKTIRDPRPQKQECPWSNGGTFFDGKHLNNVPKHLRTQLREDMFGNLECPVCGWTEQREEE